MNHSVNRNTDVTYKTMVQSDAYKALIAVAGGQDPTKAKATDEEVHTAVVTDELRAARVAAFKDEHVKASLESLKGSLKASGQDGVLVFVKQITDGDIPLHADQAEGEQYNLSRLMARTLVSERVSKERAAVLYQRAYAGATPNQPDAKPDEFAVANLAAINEKRIQSMTPTTG